MDGGIYSAHGFLCRHFGYGLNVTAPGSGFIFYVRGGPDTDSMYWVRSGFYVLDPVPGPDFINCNTLTTVYITCLVFQLESLGGVEYKIIYF